MKEYKVDRLTVRILDSREAMGEAAAKDIHDRILALLTEKETINMIFAAAPSQNEALSALVKYDDIDWSRINAFHMDEYIGLTDESKSFGRYLRDHIFGLVNFRSVNYIDFGAADHETECERYSKLLHDNPTDIVVMGIGENGHIAFNDPWVADFNDPKAVKVVKLDEVCRNQQVNDGCFDTLESVPKAAVTLTCPTLAAAAYQFCVVPAKTKANAVKRTLEGKINADCPATILRTLPAAALYLDPDSAVLL